MDTAVGPSAGGIHQPLNPPSTKVGGPRSPAGVDADHESWKPSPSTSQQPSGQWSTVTSRLVRPVSVTTAVGPPSGDELPLVGVVPADVGPASTIRSICRPVVAPGAVVRRWVPAARSTAPPHGVAITASPASRSVTDASTRTGERLAVDPDQVVAAARVQPVGDRGRRPD